MLGFTDPRKDDPPLPFKQWDFACYEDILTMERHILDPEFLKNIEKRKKFLKVIKC